MTHPYVEGWKKPNIFPWVFGIQGYLASADKIFPHELIQLPKNKTHHGNQHVVLRCAWNSKEPNQFFMVGYQLGDVYQISLLIGNGWK